MNTTKMHYLCMKVGPTMECGYPHHDHISTLQKEGKANQNVYQCWLHPGVNEIDLTLELTMVSKPQPKLNSILIIKAYLQTGLQLTRTNNIPL